MRTIIHWYQSVEKAYCMYYQFSMAILSHHSILSLWIELSTWSILTYISRPFYSSFISFFVLILLSFYLDIYTLDFVMPPRYSRHSPYHDWLLRLYFYFQVFTFTILFILFTPMHPSRAEIICWISESKRPFKTVKDHGFQSLMKTGWTAYKIPSLETVSHNVKKVFVCVHKQISKMLKVLE